VEKKQILIAAGVAGAGAVLLLRPVPPPSTASAPAAWSGAARPGAHAGRAGAPPASRALVYVAGAVVHPGVYGVGADARVRDALALAGGARPDADPVAVNLAAHVADGDEIAVPVRGSPEALAASGGSGARARGHKRHGALGPRRAKRHGKQRRSRGGDVPPASRVDINTADADTLATIPGIGAGLAERIVAFRRQNGAFTSVDELLDVSGITEHRLDALIPYVVER
jgi:competence protein ComEA